MYKKLLLIIVLLALLLGTACNSSLPEIKKSDIENTVSEKASDNGSIHIAVGSTIGYPGDLEKNLKQIESFAVQAGKDGVDLLITPEMSATGYGNYEEIIRLKEEAGKGVIYQRLLDISQRTGVVDIAGFVEQNGDKLHNACYIVHPDGKFQIQRKHMIVDRMEAPMVSGSPTGTRESGLIFELFEVAGVTCAVIICADAGINNITQYLVSKGVDIILTIAAGGGSRGDRLDLKEFATNDGQARFMAMSCKYDFTFMSEACIKYGIAQAAVNLCGYDGKEYYHGGGSSIISPMGEVVGFTPFITVIERQRPMYDHAVIAISELNKSN